MDSKNESRGNEFLDAVFALIAKTLIDTVVMDRDRAEAVADQVVADISESWGKVLVYIPQGRKRKALTMWRALYDKFTGTNYLELSREFGISLQWCYKIVRTMRKQVLAERQPDIFDGGE
jgi:Mor family transcriptional regulator